MILGITEIERRLGFHPGTEATAPLYERNRNEAIAVAVAWDRRLPPGREASLAFTALQEALMWANAAIACSQPLGPERGAAALRAVA